MHVLKRSSLWASSFFAVFSISVISVFVMASPVYAEGEKFRYMDDNTIQVWGGLVEKPSLLKKGGNPLHFTGPIDDVRDEEGQNCTYTITLEVKQNDRSKGDIDFPNFVDGSKCDTGLDFIGDKWSNDPQTIQPKGSPGPPAGAGGANDTPPANQGDCDARGENLKFVEGQNGQPNTCLDEIECNTETAFSWILCPALQISMEASEAIADGIDNLLFVQPLTPTSGGEGAEGVVYNVWSNIRNFANILFIFVMFAIIYSQATSMGISAYGVKRILPKLIAAAIMANLSFFICAIAVDISNVIGGGVAALLESAALVPVNSSGGGGDSGIMTGIGFTLATAGIAAAAIIAAVGSFGFILLALFVALLTLAARQALIIILVILAPIAFALWVMPNTEKYFKQWFELFLTALMMYPLIIAVLSGSRVAANILGAAADDFLGQVLAILVAVVPLFALPLLFKVGSFTLSKLTAMTSQGLQKVGNSDMLQRTKGRIARPYNPTLNKESFQNEDGTWKNGGKAALRKARSKNALARIATGNIRPGTRARALTKKAGEEHLEKEVGLAGMVIEDEKFSKDALEATFKRSGSNFYTKYAAAKQMANIGATDKLSNLMGSEVDREGGPDMTNVSILSRSIADKPDIKNTQHQLFFQAAGIQRAMARGVQRPQDILREGRDLAARKALDDIGPEMLLSQSHEGVQALTRTMQEAAASTRTETNPLTRNPDGTGGKTDATIARELGQALGQTMVDVAAQERLTPRLTGNRDKRMGEAQDAISAEGFGNYAYRETLETTKARIRRGAAGP